MIGRKELFRSFRRYLDSNNRNTEADACWQKEIQKVKTYFVTDSIKKLHKNSLYYILNQGWLKKEKIEVVLEISQNMDDLELVSAVIDYQRKLFPNNHY